MNILDFAKAESNCVGCGICVTACPSSHLRLGRNEWNQLAVFENGNDCLQKCSVCLRVCPFSDQAKDEDEIAKEIYNENPQHNPVLGSYIQTYVGYHPTEEKRWNAASGGLTTYLLDHLLQHKIVDAVVCATRIERSPYFKSVVCRTSEEIYRNARSAYSVVHLDDALEEVLNDDEISSFAIVALPCQAKALRNATRFVPKLKKKLKYIIGLVCGQQKSTNFSDYIAAKMGVGDLTSIDFRRKEEGRPNGNFGVFLKGVEEQKNICFSDYAKEWSFRMFAIPACNVCDDAFAETADAVFMDAWLPQYGLSDKGENLVITRHPDLDDILNQIPTVQKIDEDSVLDSQKFVIRTKRSAVKTALDYYKKRGLLAPVKRQHLFRELHWLQQYLCKAKISVSLDTDRMWVKCAGNFQTFNNVFHEKHAKKMIIGLVLNKIYAILNRI